MLQHADSRLLSNYQFGAKSALAAVILTQLLSSGNFKESTQFHHSQPLPQVANLAQSPLNSEGSTSATPPLHLECSTPAPQDICASQSSVWAEFLNGGPSNCFMEENIDTASIPASTASTTTSSWWNSSRDQELIQTHQWNQPPSATTTTTTTASIQHPSSIAPQAPPMAELEGGDWSPGQLGCLPTAPEVNEQQLSTMALEQADYSTMNTALVQDTEMSNPPSSWGSILMGGSGSEEQTLGTGTVEGLQEALFSKSFLGRPDLMSDVTMLKKAEDSPSWDFNPLKGAAAAFEMDDMNKQHQQFADERMVSVDNWSIMNSRGGGGSYSLDPTFGGGAAGGSQMFVPGKIKQEIETQYLSGSNTMAGTSNTPHSLADTFKSIQMLPASDVQTRWGAHSSRLPAMLSQVLPSTSAAGISKSSQMTFGGGNMQQMSRSYGNYNPSCKGAPETYKVQREQSSMSQHSSITSQHSYDSSKDSRHASKHMMEESREVSSDQKRSGEHHASDTFFKRPRIEQQQQPPTLPFKATTFVLQVRKEKLGERITALQQLVAPFGKTDTASVLLEAIGYIKFLHEQVQVLSTPYMKNPATTPARSNEGAVKGSSWSSEGNKSKDGDEPRQDLRSRGLCLVPITCTLQVANDNGADYWTPNIGGTGGK